MASSGFVYVGIKGSVIALNRETGEQVWATHLKGSEFVNVVHEEDRLFATTAGEIFCLDPKTGQGLWHNRLKGFGTGLSTIAMKDGLRTSLLTVLAQKRRQDDEAAAAAAGTAGAAG